MEPIDMINDGEIIIYVREVLGGPEKITQTTYHTIGKFDSPKKVITLGTYPVPQNIGSREVLKIMGNTLGKSVAEDLKTIQSGMEIYKLVFGNREGCYFDVRTYGPDRGHISALRTLYANEKEELLAAMKSAEQK